MRESKTGIHSWRPVDVIVLALAFTVSVTISAVIIKAMLDPEPLPDPQANALESIITAAISIISMYVGASIERGRETITGKPQPPTE